MRAGVKRSKGKNLAQPLSFENIMNGTIMESFGKFLIIASHLGAHKTLAY
jgi:hypothetical protein